MQVNDELLREAENRAADQGTTLTRVFEEALRAYLGRSGRRGSYRFRWRTEKGR